MKGKVDPQADIAEALELGRAYRFSIGRRMVLGLLCAAVIAATAGFVIQKMAGGTTAVQYRTEKARRGNLTITVTATGSLQPINTVSVGSELSGIIRTVEVRCNDRVKAGQSLARLDTSKLEAQLIQSRAALESSKAKVLDAQATVAEAKAKLSRFQRVRELSNGQVPSRTEMDAAEAAFERAKADLAGAKASVTQAEATVQANETDLAKSVIRSPINGVVLTRSIEPGQTVAASFQAPVLFTLAEDLSRMELHVNVDEADIGKVREGQEASFTVSAYPDRPFDAGITEARYAATTTSGVVTYETVMKVSNSDLSLRPGMTATAEIEVGRVAEGILIPGSALRFAPPEKETAPQAGGSFISRLLPRPPAQKQQESSGGERKEQRVWILKNGRISPVSVRTGAAKGGLTEVVSGNIEPGTELVIDLIEGQK